MTRATCPNGHDTGVGGLTTDNRCRTCQRVRQNRWTKTEKGKANYARHDITRRSVQRTPPDVTKETSMDERYGTNTENPYRIEHALRDRIKMLRSAVRLRHSIFADEDIRDTPNITKADRSEIRLRHSCDADVELRTLIPLVERRFWWSIQMGWWPPVPDSGAITAVSLDVPRGAVYEDAFTKGETLPSRETQR